MPFFLKRLFPLLCVWACSPAVDSNVETPPDLVDGGFLDGGFHDGGMDADIDAPDDVSQDGVRASCFSEPLLIAEASSRLGVGGIVAVANGWLVSYFGGEDGRATLVDDAGMIAGRPSGGFHGQMVPLGHDSFAQVAGHAVRRLTWTGDELREFEAVQIGIAWGSILATEGDVAQRRIRVLSYDPVEHVGDLRLSVTQLDVDDLSATGFRVHSATFGASFTDALPARLAYQQYVLQGDMLRVVGPAVSTYGAPYQTLLAQLDLDSLASGDELPYRIQERFSWEDDELGAMLQGELHRMVRHETEEAGPRRVVVESFPEHPGATGDLGEGMYQPIDETLFGILGGEGEMQIVRDSDLALLARTEMEREFSGAARLGESVAFLTKRRNSEGVVLLEMRCVRLR